MPGRKKKRRYWKHKPGWVLVECSPHDLEAGGAKQLRARLQASLEVHDIPCNRLSEDVIWHRVQSRAIDRFTTAMVGFISRCRKRALDPQQLDALVAHHTPRAPVERMFLTLATRLYRAYLDRLRVREEEDYDGLMQRAVETVARGHTVFERTSGRGDLRTLRYVFIDEFQDFSELFYRLIVALRQQNTRAEFCCVGDDWQAINGFAGSDLQFYEHFDRYFEDAQRLSLSTNYRSPRAIVGVSNALMHGRGSPAVAHKTAGGQVLLADLATFEPTLREKEQYPGDILTPSILRLARKALTTGHDVVLLCRRHGLPWYVHDQEQGATSHRGLERDLNVVRSSLPAEFRERITISTVHQYKGMEKAMVFVLDAVVCSYPLLHADWVFTRILGDNLEKLLEEERRVFYVALTRAVNTLVIFTEHGNASPFLDDIQRVQPIPAIHWPDFPPMPGTMRCMVVQVGNQEGKGSEPTLAIREGLKAEGFRVAVAGQLAALGQELSS